VARIRDLKPDLILLVAYGQILRRGLLDAPRLGALNVHFSLLPRHRGASPVQAALLAGDDETGVTTMWMTEGLDEGPIFLSEATPVGPREDAGALLSRLSELGADLLSRTLDRIERGEIVRREQDPAGATVAPKLEPSLSELGLDLDPVTFLRRVRALSPSPGSHLILRSGRLQILAAEAAGEDAAPAGVARGTILELDRAKGIRVALARGSVWLSRVRQSGRKETAGWDYANGARLKPGARLPVAVATT
jgi:methionyl-tRNA formyltransferase